MRPLCLALVVALASAASAQWKIPSPEAVDHPGAKEAPASDPRTYPDKDGFDKRAKLIVEGLKDVDLQNWRKGWFKGGGDAGKYTFGPSMAKLIADPKAADVIAMQNEERSLKEHYHFAAVNWARFYPLFNSVLTDASKQKFDAEAARVGMYLSPSGTENHKIMEWTGASVLPWYTLSGRLSHQTKEGALAKGKEMLRKYMKNLYNAGQGEWDSSTYLMFDVNGVLNIYDFSQDPDCRLMAKAILDWYLSAYALKYTDGVYCGPNQRGHASSFAGTISDNDGWLWWGGSAELTTKETSRMNWVMHAVTSSYRPNKVICNIAQKKLPLPAEQRNSKANYWHGQGQEPMPGVFPESVYLSKHYTMGSLWKGFGGQMTKFQIVATTPKGGVSVNGGSPIGRNDGDGSTQYGKFGDGNGMFDQTAQVGRAYISLTNINLPEGDAAEKWAFAFVNIPAGVEPVAAGDWQIMQIHNTFVAVRGIASKPEPATRPINKAGDAAAFLKFPGRRTGFVIETADTDTCKTIDEFKALLARTKLDASKFHSAAEIAYTSAEGKAITVKYQEGHGAALTTIDGKPVDVSNWPVYSGPFIQAGKGVMTVNDGNEGFTVDCTGDLPVYKAWRK